MEQRVYRLQSPANNLRRDELSVDDAEDILYDADDPAQFHFERFVDHDARVAKAFIVAGLVWATVFSPFLLNRELNG